MTSLFLSAAAVLAMSMQAQAAPAEAETAAPEPAVAPAPAPQAAPKPEKITDRNHPDYVRCRREAVIGSRARFTKRCFTNREWEQIAQSGNQGTRDIVEGGQAGQVSN